MKDGTILHSMNPEADPLAQWLERQLGQKAGGLQVEQLSLGHLNAMDVSAPMDSFPVEQWDKDAALQFTSQLRYLARYDAEARGGMHRYAVFVHWPTDAKETQRYFPFAVDGSAVRSSELTAATEPPTDTGVLKMLMRHLETTMKMATAQTVDIQDETAKREQRLLRRIDELEEGRFKVVALTENLLNARAEREADIVTRERGEVRKDTALTEFLSLVPMIKPKLIAAVTGEKIGEGGEATTMALRNVFEGLTIEQMKGVMREMPADKQALFVELYKGAMNVKATETKDDGADGNNGAGDKKPTAH